MTNSTFEFVCQLRNLSINLETDGDRLRCQAPEGVLTPTLSQEIARRKTEIILLLQEAKQVQASNNFSIQPVPRDGKLPLSFAQQRLWFVQQISPDSTAYNMLEALRLYGSLNIIALKESLSELIRRHEVLRTTFPTVEGNPIQLIAPPTALTLPIHNLQRLSTQEQTAQIRQMVIAEASHPFDLAVGPLVQFTLLQLSDQEYVLLLKMHHIIYDGWSLNIFFGELSQLYEAFTQGLPNPLPELPIQYADFAVWQRKWLTGVVLDRQLNYWQQQLAGVPSVLELPADRQRSPVQTFRGGVERFQLDRDLTQRLKQLSQESDATLFMTLLAAFLVLISRYSGQLDLVVGSPIANRNNLEFEQLMGFFANTLVLRGDLSGNPSFRDLQAQVRQTTLSAYAHQDLPFEMLVEKLQPVRDLSRNPLVQVVFALQNAPQSSDNLLGLTIENMPLPLDVRARFDLEVNCWETSGGLESLWCYNSELFDAATITRIAQHFETLLKAIVVNPEAQISKLPLLSQAERDQLLVEWNNTQADYPLDKCIHQLFEEQVELTPQSVAVVFEKQQLTYSELNSRANQLAHYLLSLGVSGDVLVGICVERSVEMLVGLLGILKAGGAYVPIDPDYPVERKSFILADTQTPILLTQQHLAQNLPTEGIKIICLDTDWEANTQQQIDNPVIEINALHLAYVIYTSGSTGKPKGTLITHQGLVNYLSWCSQAYGVKHGTGTIVHSPLGFDLTITSLFSPLLVGNQVEILKHDQSVETLSNSLPHHSNLSLVKITPAHLELLNQQISSREAANRTRAFIIGGDNLLAENIAFWQEFAPETMLVNEYGPTETVVGCCIYQVPIDQHHSGSIPIGRPIANTQVYILDSKLQPVPIGVPGELHIGGAGVARGYLNRPDLTVEKFIPNPFNNSLITCNSSKLYKTGDLARYLPSGNIEYLGRIDNQVKIRGFRIELGEIEAVLSQHEHVQLSVVIAREDIPGTKRLVAYIVPHTNVTPTLSELSQFFKSKLPDYMIPTAMVILESLPLTPNGKVDRRALLVPELRTKIEGSSAPRTPVEEKLVQIWSQVLRVERVGIHDNFFSLGGDSILSIQIIARAKLVGIELTIKQLFANQTIAELATVAGTTKALSIAQELVTGTLPLTPIQQWFFEEKLREPYHFNQSFLLTVPSDIKLEFLEQIWQHLLSHHDALRLRFTQTDGTWQQIHAHPTQTNKILCFDLSTVRERELHTEIETTANSLQASLNLSENLAQVALFRLGNHQARLLIIIHHLVIDGVSWRILLEDLQSGYEQLTQGKAIQLQSKTTSFKDWAFHLLEYAQSNRLKSELAYWLSASNSEVSPIPIDYATGVNTIASRSTVSVSLTVDETYSLLQDVPKAYNTQINDVLLTALVLVVSRWNNSESMLFNLEGHGREDIIDGVDLSRTVGWFTTLFPVVLTLEAIDEENIAEVLKSVKEQLRAIPNKGIGYGLLRYLNEDPQISAQLQTIPTAQISFNYLGQFTQVLNTSSVMQLASEKSGQNQSLQGERSHLLDISAIIANEQLQIDWIYSSHIHQHKTIENLAFEFVETLRSLIAHCLSKEHGGYTPTDFPLIKLNQLELDGVLARLALKPERQSHWQNIEEIYPLSPMQEGMLFESLSAPSTGVYFEQITCTFTGSFNVEAFEQAWQQVVARHSIFRTAFVWESLSQPVQIVYRQVPVSVDTLDWRELSKLEQSAQLETFLDSERQQGLQLSPAPLMRLYLLHIDENTYQFVWSVHHLLLDGWSFPLVFQDLFEFYQAINDGSPLALPPTLSYRNYIAWLQQQDQDKAREFWRQKLQGFSAPTPLTVDKPLSNRSDNSSYSEQVLHLTPSTTEKAVSFVRQHQLTMNNLVQATWGLLLSRYSEETDVVFGATVSGRPPALVGVESMVGLFINTLPVRMQISDNSELLSLLKDLQAQQVESEQFSFFSLVEIQGVSDVPRGTSLFESIVVFENYPVDTAVIEDNSSFSISNFRGIERTNYPLTVIAIPGEQLSLKVSYDTSRFEHETISRMLEHYVTLLSAIVDNPQQRIDQLPLLTQSEQQQLLVEWNDTKVDYACDKCIHHLFEEQVERTPDAVAVVFDNQQLTYGELNCRSNQLAHYLRSLGVRASVLVGISVERSLEMVVGLLGILKAGGAYVPLDPGYPTERLRFMLLDAQISVLLTQQSLEYRLKEQTAQLVCLDTEGQEIWQSSQDNLITEVQATNLAYVIYTSGSTGQPKGVEVIHRGVNRLLFGVNYVELNATQRFLQMAPISFDASTFEIWGALLHGGLCVILTESIPTAKILGEEIDKHGITVLWLTAALFNSIIDENAVALSGIRQLLIGGEALSVAHVQKALSRLPLTQIINGYGPTESTTFTCCHPILRQLERTIESIPIGRPIANTQVYILDSELQPVPVGVPGELHIGGAGLARGYLNARELTCEKFILNPFNNSKITCPESKLYKTGDKARYLPSGNIEYLGRIDNQVKIRGFRIELGEIEAVLNQHSDVQSAVVIAREDAPGNKRLVAYIVPHPQITPVVSVLRTFLAEKLPDYMVPSVFVFLEALPLTSNGKVDRRALPTSDIHSSFQDKYVAPRTPTEEMLALIWAQVLKVEPIGIHDNFFSLGGHSLLATQLVSRIRNIFKLELPLRSLFTTATVTELARSIQQLQQENVKLTYTDILPRTLNAELPLSFAQQRLWFIDQLEPHTASYNIPMALRLGGNLNVSALQQSLNEIIQRHEALRTNFITVDGQVTQIIHTVTNCPVTVIDLQHLPWREREIASQQLAQLLAVQPFDLSCHALLRATLVVLSQTEHVLNVCMHHVVSDGWSMGVFVDELAALYNAYSIGKPSPLLPLPIQYADFAIWQRQWLAGVVLQSQLSYWREQLAGAPTFLPLPTDRPRKAVQTFAGAYHELALSVELTQKLTKLSQEKGVTLFMTLLAGFNTLLYRYTGQTDILVGSPIANRHHREIESLIGFFVNTLVLRTDLSTNPSFSELLLQTRSMALDAYAHQDLPLEMLVEALQPERDLSHTPLFQVMFVLQNAPMSSVELSGLNVNLLPIETATAKFDLTLSMENTATGLVSVWEYNTDLFDSSTIKRMMSHFVTLLEAIVANPQQKISALPLLTASESQQLLVEWNDTTIDYACNKCIPDLFEEQVARTPDAVAVVFVDERSEASRRVDQQLTYQQLNCRANQLAHHLRSLGVSADVLVGICVERSLEMVVGLLGILKAGGAYVPLDPEYPQDRLSFMIKDAQPRVLLTQQHLVEKLQQHTSQLVCLDTDRQLLTQLNQHNLISGVQGDNLGYVIYTSGSTGQPKGVAMNQSALCNLILWQLENTTISDGVKTLQFAPVNFDVSFQEMFSTWCSGGTLVLIREELRREPLALLSLLTEKAVARVFMPFVGLQQLAEVAVESESVTSHLQEIITAGEQLQMTPAICNWLRQLNECTLHNHYGPSESHVVTTFTLSHSAKSWPLLPPIGRPIANTRIYILDQYLQPVPVGVPGELYIGGASLARGYLNRPDLTVEKFIDNPFDNSKLNCPKSKLYKTGDKARYLPDGNIEYLERIDFQVKIRGFRIELGEIEAVLSQHSHVQASCVIAREDPPGDKRLVAYIVPQPEVIPTVSELRSFLKDKLPKYMVPSVIVILESLPLTPSGKVDRRALKAPEPILQLSEKFVAPRTPTEEMLALIWAQVLNVELVGRHDNFFELGGHSLLATQLISRVRSSLVVELPLRSLFVAPTIAELSPHIQRLQQQNLKLTYTDLLPRDLNAELPLSFAQQRLWFLDQLEPLSASYNLFMALRLVGNLKISALEQSLIEIIQRHEALRTNFITVDGQARQIIHDSTNWTVSIVDLQHLPWREQEITSQKLAQLQAIQPFDLSCDSLLRATLVLLSETEYVLNVCMHHVVSDGWSMGVFVEELTTLYNAYSMGKPSPLVPLAIQYADFAIWQRQWLAGDVLQSQLSYWREQLANAPTLLPLPTDRPKGSVQTFAGAYHKLALSVELTQKLTKFSTEQGVTLFMTLLAGFNTLLYRYTGQTDILLGSPIANRHHSEIEPLIGFFVNTLVLRTDLSGNPSFSELLPRLRTMTLDAYAHQDLPFEMLVEALQPERALSHTPLFQVMFVLQNAPMSDVELTGLSVSSLPIETATTKFDLTLSMENTAIGLVSVWEYNTDLFDSSTIERMASHFRTLLEAIVTNPTERISQLPLLTQSEQQQLLVEWNDTRVDYACDKCIPDLFEEQVKCTPDAVAVVFENQQLTYEQLNCRANQLAHYLRSLGVRADVLVGICVERSLDMVVGLLGILKAGGAYVPLDPQYPTERLSFMLEDAQISLLLTQQSLVDVFIESAVQLVCLNTDWQLISQFSDDNLITERQATNLAYVIYTSGSTGQPKGVEVIHRGVNRLLFGVNYVDLDAAQRFLQIAPISFDASTFEIWGALLHGGLCVIFKESIPTAKTLGDEINKHDITVLWLTAALFNSIIDENAVALSGIRQLLIGGEALSVAHVHRALSRLPLTQIINGYGPTESTTFTCCYPIPRQLKRNIESIPIGGPIANTQVYILDKYLQPVPVGVAGELHIAGAGLARGYLNRPDLTLEKFINNPFKNSLVNCPESKLYKTGDLARYLPSGNIEYLGRIDHQVKIRGFRIELEEIEATLSQHEDVQSIVVIAREDITGNKRLVAYIVPQPEVTPTTSKLRQFLKTKLPEYMLPSAIVFLESLPLTPNGKIDKSALPVPDSRAGIEVSLVAPRTRVEAELALIWGQVLRVERVGIHDNFFSLGGDSILSIQMIAKAKLVEIELTIKQLFANQTIAELATVAGTTKARSIAQELVTGTLPLTPIQEWFFEQKLSERHHFNQSFLLTVPSDIKLEFLEQVCQQLLLHHDALRLRFTQTDETWQQIHAQPTQTIEIPCFDLSTVPESELHTQIETTANSLQASLNLSENLAQLALFKLGDYQARLLIVIHHLVVDGVSWRILLEDLLTGYEQLIQGKAIQLQSKTTSFKDWAHQLQEYAQTEVLKSELAYWLSASRASISPIPRDYALGLNTVASTNTVLVSLTALETHSLLQDVPKAYKTQINDVLLTALVLVLSSWTHSKSVLFNLEGHGREDIIDGVDLSRTVGWFTTIFPVVLKLEAIDRDNIAQALKTVKEQLRAIPNKGIGYGLLRYLNEDPQISAQLQTIPSAEISFNYLGQFSQVLNTSSVISLAPESSGQIQSLQGERPYLVDMNAIITNEQLQINWSYSSNIHQHKTIENLANEFVATLRSLIAHCLSPDNAGYTPTDFPLIKLNQLELDRVLARLALKSLGQSHSQNLEDIYPLSPMQEGMLFETLYAPDSGVYFEQITCTFAGNFNVEAFKAAWQQVVARHSIFRTAFVSESLSQPVQVVYRQVQVSVETLDWRELSNVEQETQFEAFLDGQRQQGLQLSQAPLMRLHLLQIDEKIYQFVWSFHHILLDGWSFSLVFQDLLAFYQAINDGSPLALPPTLSYRNYIAWLQQQDQDQAREFWRQKLQSFSALTPLTVDKPLSNRSDNSSYSEQVLHLTPSTTEKAVSFVRQHQLTMNNLVQATWGLLLCRYSEETDVVFGATVSGRPPSLVGVESMVGLLINTVPVRVQISAHTELLRLLKDLQSQHVESEQFSFFSLVEIQGLSDVPRGTSLFESIVVFENYPVDTAVVEDNDSLTLSNFRAIEQTNYPLTVIAIPGEQLSLKMSYDTSRFEHETISRMLGHFVTMLSAIVANPQQRIHQLPLLTQSEQQQLLLEWNDTTVDYTDSQCIHHLFEKQVELTPDAVAVVFDNQQLTYTELNCRANQLAHYLQSLGVGADVLVGISVERSLDMVVGLLGILKAGGAYVPLDADLPTERRRFMLEDAQVRVLLTQQHLAEKLQPHQAHAVYLDSDWDKIAQNSESNPLNGTTPSNLAYVIYTSGSTGLPKGVLVNHNNVTRLFAATQPRYDFNSEDVWTLFHSIAFDFSVWEIWGALLYGGRLVVVPYLVTRSPESFYQLLWSEKVTILNQTPSAFGQLTLAEQSIAAINNLNLRLVIFGGESLEINSLQPWFERHGDQSPQLVNMYGITETTVHVTIRPLSKNDLNTTTSVIGRPIPDLQVYVLDQHLQPVPIGVPGQMYVGGAGVSRGYLNRPELTAERFISNPFQTSRGGERLYKTGDMARYLLSGELEYLGRIDFQVKIRGFRIELGEIEAILSQHSHVQASCVIAKEEQTGDQRLVAYIVPQLEQTPTVSELRSFLKSKLPDYMVPSAIVILESLPLTNNGKVDRHALKALFNPSGSDTFVSPRNTIELQLVQIWSKILKVDNVGVKDNFFDLGGHSLLAFYLMAQIKQQFGKDIPLAILFQHPTIEDLAPVLQKDSDASGWSPLVAIQPTGSKPPFFCIPGAGGFPFYLYNLARCLGSDQPFYSFQTQGQDGELAVISKVEDIAAYYIQAMQAVQPQGPYFLGGHSFGGKVVFEMAQQLLCQGQVVALVAILDTTAPIAYGKPQELDNARWLFSIAKSMQMAFAKDLEMDAEPLHCLALNEQLKYVLEYLHMLDILPRDADTIYLKHLLQAYKANSTTEYVPQQINPVPITLFRASESIPEEEAALPSEFLQDVSWGWNGFLKEPVDIQFVPGNHVSMMTLPHVQVLAERLNACIKQRTTLNVVD